jgi:hypothetical protein
METSRAIEQGADHGAAFRGAQTAAVGEQLGKRSFRGRRELVFDIRIGKNRNRLLRSEQEDGGAFEDAV